MKQKISITIDSEALRKIDSAVDNITIRNRSQAIEYLVKSALGENKQAVILAGGSEDSLRISAKEYRITARVGNSTLIERAVRKLRQHGVKEIFVVARHPVLTAVFDVIKDGAGLGVSVQYIEETESKGTAASLRLVRGKIKGAFFVVYGHILFDKINLDALWNEHVRNGGEATLLLTTTAKPSTKGTVRMEGSRILNFVQKPKESDVYLVFSPILIAEPGVLDYEGDSLEYDLFPKLAERGLLQGHMSSERRARSQCG